MKRWSVFLLLLFLIPAVTIAQDDWDEEEDEWADDEDRGWSIALNLGAYFAGKGSGNIYNGACLFDVSNDPNGVRCYDIMSRLTLNINDVNFINNYYGSTGFTGPIDMNPWNMRYQPAFMYGLNILYDFNWSTGIVFDLNVANLKAVDQFTLQFIGTGQQLNGQNDVRLFTITGREQRFNMNLGLRNRIEINRESNYYIDLGGSMLGTKLVSNTITVAERNFELILGADNPNQFIQYRPRTNVGFGFYGGAGVEFEFNDNYRAEAGIVISRDKVILETFEDNLWNWSAVFRFGL